MPSLTAFNNFIQATGNKLRSGPDEIINDAVKNTYYISRMLKGQGNAENIQSGAKIIDRIMLSDAGTSIYYDPNEDLAIENVDTLKAIEVPWRFNANHFSYTEQEIKLNSGDPQTYYKNLLKAKRQAMVTDSFNTWEERLWAAPSTSTMEAATGKEPYSIRAFVTSSPATGTFTALPSGFTTVQTLSPSTETNWRNQLELYDPGDLTNPDSGLIDAFDQMFMKVKFVSPRGKQEYFESDAMQKMAICTNREGRTNYLRLTRDANDRLVGNDLGAQQADLAYAGVPIEYVAQLDSTFTAGLPAYYFLNLKYLHPIWHSEEYMVEKEPKSHPRQPFSWVVWSSTYYNLFCASRRRQGMIAPTGTAY